MPENTTVKLPVSSPASPPARVTPEFRTVVRGYDREEVDAYIERLRAEADEHRSPSGAVRRALEQVGDEVAGILKRAHETAVEVTSSAQREAEDRLVAARREADGRIAEARATSAAMTAQSEARLRDLDLDTDRIWAERDRIVQDARELARQLLALAEAAAERFPAEDATEPIEITRTADPVDDGNPEAVAGADAGD